MLRAWFDFAAATLTTNGKGDRAMADVVPKGLVLRVVGTAGRVLDPAREGERRSPLRDDASFVEFGDQRVCVADFAEDLVSVLAEEGGGALGGAGRA